MEVNPEKPHSLNKMHTLVHSYDHFGHFFLLAVGRARSSRFVVNARAALSYLDDLVESRRR